MVYKSSKNTIPRFNFQKNHSNNRHLLRRHIQSMMIQKLINVSACRLSDYNPPSLSLA